MVEAALIDMALIVLLGYGGWRRWRHHDEQLGLVMVIAAGLSIAVTAFGMLFLAATPL